jgi:dihydropteroate synthase
MTGLVLPGGGRLDLRERPLVMAIVNCTEDSFFPGSHSHTPEEAVDRALRAEAEGADLIDLGAESTRPGAFYISGEEELRRLIPVIRGVRKKSSLPLSVDTRRAGTARAALDEGADIINDISALEDDPALGSLCAERKAPVVLMHKKGVPRTMQEDPRYEDPVREVGAYLREAVRRARAAGIPGDHIILDPGIGFGKGLEDNLALIAALPELSALGFPVLMGLSRKRFIGELTGREAGERLAGTIAANAVSLLGGAAILRVHDVKEGVDTVRVVQALREAQKKG